MAIAGRISIKPYRRKEMNKVVEFIKKHKKAIAGVAVLFFVFVLGAVIF